MPNGMNEYQQYLIEEFADEYRERRMSRRDLLRRAVLIMGSVPAGLAALAVVGCGGDDDADEVAKELASPPTPTTAPSLSPAASATAAQESGVSTADVKFAGPGSDLLGYVARPAQKGTYPGVVIIHENRGLVEHTKDVTRRYAREGFVAIAVDLVSRDGGSKADVALNTGFLGRSNPDDFVADLKAYVAYLGGQEGVKPGGVGVTGFCFGGGYVFEAAIASPQVKAAIPYYGICRLIDQLATTRAAVLAIYGQLDTRVSAQADRVRAELAKTGRPFDVLVYPGANHAFFNDTGASYNADAAKDAWTKSLDWFRRNL